MWSFLHNNLWRGTFNKNSWNQQVYIMYSYHSSFIRGYCRDTITSKKFSWEQLLTPSLCTTWQISASVHSTGYSVLPCYPAPMCASTLQSDFIVHTVHVQSEVASNQFIDFLIFLASFPRRAPLLYTITSRLPLDERAPNLLHKVRRSCVLYDMSNQREGEKIL